MSIYIKAEANANDIAESVATDLGLIRNNYSGLLDFIVDIDEYVCDLQFTKLLRDRMQEIIDLEEE